MSDFTMTIDGKAVLGDSPFGVINPATGQVFAQAPECNRTQLDAAMAAATAAFKPWSRDLAKRRAAVLAAAEARRARRGELAPILTQEQGKPLAKAGEELFGGAIW